MAYEWTDADADALIDFCKNLGIDDPTVPLKVWAHESGLNPNAYNVGGGASGIFQLMPDTARMLGYDVGSDPKLEAFRLLSVQNQLVWASKFYKGLGGKDAGVAAFYLWTFLPAMLHLANTPQGVVCGEDGPFAWAYRANRGFDAAGKGFIVVQDLVDSAERAFASCGQTVAALVANRS